MTNETMTRPFHSTSAALLNQETHKLSLKFFYNNRGFEIFPIKFPQNNQRKRHRVATTKHKTQKTDREKEEEEGGEELKIYRYVAPIGDLYRVAPTLVPP